MNISGLLTFAVVYLVFVLTPGPGVAATVARGLGAGLNKSFGYVAGFVIGDIVWFTIAATGLAALSNSFETTFMIFKYAGCAYLLFIAWKIWKTPIVGSDVAAKADIPGQWSGFLGTLTLTLSNPKVIVFFLSLLPLVIDVQRLSISDFLRITLVMATVCGTSILAVLYLASQARKIFRSPTALRRINRGSAGMMAGAAVVIGLKG